MQTIHIRLGLGSVHDSKSWVLLEDKQDLSLGWFDILVLYLGFDRTLHQNLNLNLWIHVYFTSYLLDFVLLSLWLIFCRELVEINKKLELEPPCTTTCTVRAQDRAHLHRPCKLARTVQIISGNRSNSGRSCCLCRGAYKATKGERKGGNFET